MKEPFILTKGGSVHDLATLVHRELAEKLKKARVWGAGVHDGQQVHQTHVLTDKDVVELHF
jgi:ribosome-interacting GTPase 1